MKKLYIAAMAAALCFLVSAANATDIAPAYSVSPDKGTITWTGIGNGDSVQQASINLQSGFFWPESCHTYRMLVDGTTTGLDFKLQAGKTSGSLKDIDTAQMTDGVRFSSASTGNMGLVCLCNGDYADIAFASTGTGDATVSLDPAGKCQ